MNAAEIVCLVDRTGAVVGRVERHVVRRENLLHAATAVLVRDPRGRIFVHRRSPDKDWAPSHHDAAVGGVLRYGEVPYRSAIRELEEEVGVSGVELRQLGTALFEDDTVRCFEHCYEVVWEGPLRFMDAEVVWGEWMELAELGRLLRRDDWLFVPDTRALLARLARTGVGDYPALLAPR